MMMMMMMMLMMIMMMMMMTMTMVMVMMMMMIVRGSLVAVRHKRTCRQVTGRTAGFQWSRST